MAVPIVDDYGHTMMVKHHKNRYIGAIFSLENIEGISKLSLRDDDILMCAYPKCGTHWLWEQVRMLVAGKIIDDTVDKDSQMMEFFKPEYLDKLPSPRILNNHCFPDDQPADLPKGKGKLIFVYRNPKDVAVSWYHHALSWTKHEYKGTFQMFLRRLVQGIVPSNSPFDYWKTWERFIQDNPQVQVLTVRYEDLQTDAVRELQRIGKFLGYDCDIDLLTSIVQATSFDSMIKTKSNDALRGKNGQLVMYRKGKVGDWKNHFTVSDNEWFDGIIQKELGNSELFKFIYSID